MAMTACKECGKAVSTEAKTCPHCGTSAPAKKKGKGGIGKWLLIAFAIGLVVMILPKQDKTTTAASVPPKVQAKSPPPKKAEKVLPEVCKITKKDGALDARLDRDMSLIGAAISAAGAVRFAAPQPARWTTAARVFAPSRGPCPRSTSCWPCRAVVLTRQPPALAEAFR